MYIHNISRTGYISVVVRLRTDLHRDMSVVFRGMFVPQHHSDKNSKKCDTHQGKSSLIVSHFKVKMEVYY